MQTTGFDDYVLVLDSDDQIVDPAGGHAPAVRRAVLEDPDVTRRPLPDGSTLVSVPSGAAEASGRLAHAFVHAARSPLNAMALNLDIAQERLANLPPDVTEALARTLGRASKQVWRIDELLRVFLDLWAPPLDKPCDLVRLVSDVGLLASHMSSRRSASLQFEVPAQPVEVSVAPRALVDALFCLVDESLGNESHVTLTLTAAPHPRLTVVVANVEPPAWLRTVRAFTSLGASVAREGGRFTVAFVGEGGVT